MFYGVTNFTADAREFTSVSYLFTRAASRGGIQGANRICLKAIHIVTVAPFFSSPRFFYLGLLFVLVLT